MKWPGLILLLLLSLAFSTLTFVLPKYLVWADVHAHGDSLLASFMGDSRRLFANQLFTEADVYMHSGYYPTIFDTKKLHEPKPNSSKIQELEAHVAHEKEEHENHAGHEEHEEEGGDFLGKPLDWIDSFSRHFFITEHSHLENGNEREMLPWLKLSAEMDPNQIDTYTVGAFWLRVSLKRPKEAEEFLREGLRYNPNNPELLLELGKIYLENYKDVDHARNVWELAKTRWYKLEAPKEHPDTLLLEEIVARLADMEFKAGNYQNALVNYKLLRSISPVPQVIDEHVRKTQEMIDSGGKVK